MSSKNRKLQVFVSSTFEDLKEERQVAVEAILNAGHIPAGMELFAAGDQSQMYVIRDWIQESDVYMLILGGRYGSIDPETGKSYTQLEYEFALEIGKPHFAVVISDKGLDLKVGKQGKEVLELKYSEKYNEFKKLVTTSKLVKFWDDTSGIELAIFKSLAEFNKREELIGWVRGDQVVDSGALAEEMARLGRENAELRTEVETLRANSANDLGGISFDALFKILEEKKYQISNLTDVLGHRPPLKYLNRLEKYKLVDGTVTGNDMLITFWPEINGSDLTLDSDWEGIYMFLQANSLTNFSKSGHSTASVFTEMGRKYFFKLRSLDKYHDWNYED